MQGVQCRGGMERMQSWGVTLIHTLACGKVLSHQGPVPLATCTRTRRSTLSPRTWSLSRSCEKSAVPATACAAF